LLFDRLMCVAVVALRLAILLLRLSTPNKVCDDDDDDDDVMQITNCVRCDKTRLVRDLATTGLFVKLNCCVEVHHNDIIR